MTDTVENTILLVDDQPENLQAIADAFIEHHSPYKILKAPNGSIALKLAQSKLPDLIITDWDMPEMDGISLIKALKIDPRTKSIPIIMCTGVMTSSQNLETAIKAGAVDFVRKPIDKIELLARVHSMLCLSESYKQISLQKEQLAAEKKKVEKLLIDSQLAFLRNQVSPHFLMNTLNNIHALIDVDAEEAQNSIIILSKLMRHLLYESDRDANPIGLEIDFIKNYVDLMKLRFEGKAEIKLDISNTIPNVSIPPLLFTSLLENAFKHGIAINSPSYIYMKINAQNGELVFEIKNGIPQQTLQNNKPGGIGIENTRKRLNLIYGERSSFEVFTNKEEYTAILSVPITTS